MQRNQLIKLIHVAKPQLGLTDEDYRAIISSIKADASSCTHLNIQQLNQLYQALKQLGFVPQSKTTPPPSGGGRGEAREAREDGEAERARRRSPDKASPAQLRYIKALWAQKARHNTPKALNHMCQRITGIQHLEWLGKHDATKLITALRNM